MENKFLGLTPPLGWNSWNTFTWQINEELIKQVADTFVESGLKDAGYEYVVIDDCWSEKQRDENGRLVPDHWKFSEGIKPVADYVHSKGLKFGMYSCAGTHTCGGHPGSFEHEFDDAETFASWGVDYLKYDYCYKPDHIPGEVLYKRMSAALRNCGRDIMFSACNWGNDNVYKWIRESGAHLFRSTGDIQDNWESIKRLALSQIGNECYGGNFCHNDIDMLVVGMHGGSNNEWINSAEGGVNEVLAGIFGMRDWEVFADGCGRVGEVEPITVPELARKIYAGADIFLMPSQFEPCGLSQMIALRYGTLPVVRETGGLYDTIHPYRADEDCGNGFTFAAYNAHDMMYVLRQAEALYADRCKWRRLMRRAMRTDFSWNASAQRYLQLYQSMLTEREFT